MTVTSILLLFHLLIRSIACINPFSVCSHYLEADQVTYDANRLSGFSVMEISIERNFRSICKIIFFYQQNTFIITYFTSSIDIFYIWSIWYFSRYFVSVLQIALTQLAEVLVDLLVLISDRLSLTPFLGLYSSFWPFFC